MLNCPGKTSKMQKQRDNSYVKLPSLSTMINTETSKQFWPKSSKLQKLFQWDKLDKKKTSPNVHENKPISKETQPMTSKFQKLPPKSMCDKYLLSMKETQSNAPKLQDPVKVWDEPCSSNLCLVLYRTSLWSLLPSSPMLTVLL